MATYAKGEAPKLRPFLYPLMQFYSVHFRAVAQDGAANVIGSLHNLYSRAAIDTVVGLRPECRAEIRTPSRFRDE